MAPADLRFLSTFDKLNCGLLASTADGVVIAINQKLLSWLGYEEEEVLDRPTEELVPPELRGYARIVQIGHFTREEIEAMLKELES